MEFIALKELPQGQQPGDRFETTEEMGAVLIQVGAARVATDEDKADEKPEPTSSRRSAGYRRRDLQAQGGNS